MRFTQLDSQPGYRGKSVQMIGQWCGTVDSVVAYGNKGARFESSHQQLLLNNYLLLTVCSKDENKEKEAENGPFFKRGAYM